MVCDSGSSIHEPEVCGENPRTNFQIDFRAQNQSSIKADARRRSLEPGVWSMRFTWSLWVENFTVRQSISPSVTHNFSNRSSRHQLPEPLVSVVDGELGKELDPTDREGGPDVAIDQPRDGDGCDRCDHPPTQGLEQTSQGGFFLR